MRLLVAVDDLILNKDGRRVTADETVEFSVSGTVYEIDLTAANAAQMLKDLDPYIQAAKVTKAVAKPKHPARTIAESRIYNEGMRKWAVKRGFPVTALKKKPKEGGKGSRSVGWYYPEVTKEAYKVFLMTGRAVTYEEFVAAGNQVPDAAPGYQPQVAESPFEVAEVQA